MLLVSYVYEQSHLSEVCEQIIAAEWKVSDCLRKGAFCNDIFMPLIPNIYNIS